MTDSPSSIDQVAGIPQYSRKPVCKIWYRLFLFFCILLLFTCMCLYDYNWMQSSLHRMLLVEFRLWSQSHWSRYMRYDRRRSWWQVITKSKWWLIANSSMSTWELPQHSYTLIHRLELKQTTPQLITKQVSKLSLMERFYRIRYVSESPGTSLNTVKAELLLWQTYLLLEMRHNNRSHCWISSY